MPAVVDVEHSSDASIDGILSGLAWAAGGLTYGFPTSGSLYGTDYSPDLENVTFRALTADQQNAVTEILAQYAAVAGLSFTSVAGGDAILRYGMSSAPNPAWAYYPSDDPTGQGGDVWLNRFEFNDPVRGNYAWSSILHETGHALGLKHGHEWEEGFPALPLDRDSLEFTVMTYRGYIGDPINGGYTLEDAGYPQTLMMLDIAALQYMYGANFSTNSGDTVYSWSPTTGQHYVNGIGQGAPEGNRVFMTLWDGGGADTYDFSNYTTDLSVDLAPGGWTTMSVAQLAHLDDQPVRLARGNVANALLYAEDARSLIENAIGGSGADRIQGNQAANHLVGGAGIDSLIGGAGNDTLDGGVGADYMLGGAGDDTFLVDNSFDLVDEDVVYPGFGQGGFDTIISSANWFWDVYSIAERMVITAEATDPSGAGVTIVGSVFGNEMIGNAATNILFGRGGSDVYRAGDGIDYISLSTLGLTEANAYAGVDGSNVVVVERRETGATSYDIVFEFEPGKDKLDVSDYGYASVGEVLTRGADDGQGNAYFALGDGFDYLYMIGLTTAEIAASDFII